VLQSQIVTESERCFFELRFSVALLRNLADFETEIHLSREKPEHANAPNARQQIKIFSMLTRTVKWTLFTAPMSLIKAFFDSWTVMYKKISGRIQAIHAK